MVILNSDNCPPLNSSVTNILIIILLLVVNHGYEPQSKYWKYFAASCWVSYPTLKRDNSTNASYSQRVSLNWSFTNKKRCVVGGEKFRRASEYWSYCRMLLKSLL